MRIGVVAVGEVDDGEVGRLARLEAAGRRLGAEAQAPKRVAIVSRSGPPSDGVAAVEEPHLVEDAQGGARRQAVGPQADDDPALEHGAIGMGAWPNRAWVRGQ